MGSPHNGEVRNAETSFLHRRPCICPQYFRLLNWGVKRFQNFAKGNFRRSSSSWGIPTETNRLTTRKYTSLFVILHHGISQYETISCSKQLPETHLKIRTWAMGERDYPHVIRLHWAASGWTGVCALLACTDHGYNFKTVREVCRRLRISTTQRNACTYTHCCRDQTLRPPMKLKVELWYSKAGPKFRSHKQVTTPYSFARGFLRLTTFLQSCICLANGK